MAAVWRMASHALFFTDLDLSATDDHWAPPPPFSARDEDGYVVPPTYSRDQLLDYVDHCGRKVDDVFAELTDDHAAAVVPHRNGDRPLADILLAGLLHLQLHSTQVRTFLRTKGVRCADE